MNNKLINGLRILEIDSIGPLYEKGASVNDIIIQINNNEGSWKNLTSSLKFASLGNSFYDPMPLCSHWGYDGKSLWENPVPRRHSNPDKFFWASSI